MPRPDLSEGAPCDLSKPARRRCVDARHRSNSKPEECSSGATAARNSGGTWHHPKIRWCEETTFKATGCSRCRISSRRGATRERSSAGERCSEPQPFPDQSGRGPCVGARFTLSHGTGSTLDRPFASWALITALELISSRTGSASCLTFSTDLHDPEGCSTGCGTHLLFTRYTSFNTCCPQILARASLHASGIIEQQNCNIQHVALRANGCSARILAGSDRCYDAQQQQQRGARHDATGAEDARNPKGMDQAQGQEIWWRFHRGIVR